MDTVRVTPAPAGGSIFVIGTGWGGMNRGVIERHRKLLRQNLVAGQSTTSEAVIGEGLAMIASSWLAEATRSQFVVGQLSGTTITYVRSLGIFGMVPVDSSQGPIVSLELNTGGTLQRVSRPSASGFTPSESSAFFSMTVIMSLLESAVIEQTQPKDKNGQVSVAASTSKLIDILTIYDFNDPTISGDGCAYYAANKKQPRQLYNRRQSVHRGLDWLFRKHEYLFDARLNHPNHSSLNRTDLNRTMEWNGIFQYSQRPRAKRNDGRSYYRQPVRRYVGQPNSIGDDQRKPGARPFTTRCDRQLQQRQPFSNRKRRRLLAK